jgi:retinol-binding protein 3
MKKANLSKRQRVAIMTLVALSAAMAGRAPAQPATAPIQGTPPEEPTPMIRMVPAVPPGAPSAISSAPISAVDKANLIAATVRELNNRYVFPETAKRAGDALMAKLKAKEYDAINDGQALAKKLTDDLFALTKDAHVRYQYSPAPMPQRPSGQQATEAEIVAEQLDAAQKNFGVERIERLPGNIGYIDVRLFHSVVLAGSTIAAAMNLVAHTDALIIDLRLNDGGYPETVALMTSYLFNERKHLSNFYSREGDGTEQSWSLDWVPGKRFGSTKPVYVLTSMRSASGAEEFAYNLKHLKRATLVGETTVGAANPGEFVQLTPHFTLFIPNGRAINPITKTNWEGVGVEPDVKVASADALRTAQLLALKGIAGKEKDQRRAGALGYRIAELEKGAPK